MKIVSLRKQMGRPINQPQQHIINRISHNVVGDLDANYYTKHSFLQNNLAKKVLETLLLNSCAYVLDIGCGDGRITAELATRVKQGKVIGVDASPGMIEFALKNFPKKNFPNLDFLQEMAEKVEFSDQYDLIVSFSCFHWLKDPKLAIRRLSSFLKRNGEFLILTYPKESPYYRYLQTALRKYPDYYLLSANHTMLSSVEYKNVFLENHLEILEFHERHLIESYDTPEEIQRYIKGWLNSYVLLPEALQDAFLQDVSTAVLEDPATHRDKKIEIPYTALIMKARKK
jgi:trans-aconitate 2-methyltransferase